MQVAPVPAPAFYTGSVVWYCGAGSRPWPCCVIAKSRKPGRWILDVYEQTEGALDGLEARMRPFHAAFGELAGDDWCTGEAPFARAVRAARRDADGEADTAKDDAEEEEVAEATAKVAAAPRRPPRRSQRTRPPP